MDDGNESPNKPSILAYDRETLLRIGREISTTNFSKNQRAPMNYRQTPNQRRGPRDARVMGQPLMHPPGVRIGWSMGQPLAIPPTPPPRVLELTTRVTLPRDFRIWRSHRNAGRNDVDDTPQQTEMIARQTREILDKLTPENFDEFCEKFLKLDLNERQDRISAVIKVVFEKAIDEPSLSTLYAKMVHHVCQHSQETSKKFRKEILDQCQREFQKTNVDEDEISKKCREIEEASGDKKNALKLELVNLRTLLRRRSVCNTRFVGELFNFQMLTPKIMVNCIQMLLGNQDEESYECLYNLLMTIGQKLDVSLKDVENRVREAKSHRGSMPKFIPEDNYMDKTFSKLRTLSENVSLSSRIRVVFLKLVELRDRQWLIKKVKLE